MKSITSIPILAASLAVRRASADVKFRIDTSQCSSDSFGNMDVTVSCDGEHAPGCMFGDTAYIDGTIAASAAFDDANMTMRACLVNYCPAENVRSAGTLCGDWLTPAENITCGEPGMYNVSGVEEIPVADIPDSWSWLVRVTLGADQGDCEVSGSRSSQSYQSTGESRSSGSSSGGGGGGSSALKYSAMGAFFGTAFGAVYAAKRKLICSDADVDDDIDNTNAFIEMRQACAEMGV